MPTQTQSRYENFQKRNCDFALMHSKVPQTTRTENRLLETTLFPRRSKSNPRISHLAGHRSFCSRDHDRMVRLLHLWQSGKPNLTTFLSKRKRYTGTHRLPFDVCGWICC